MSAQPDPPDKTASTETVHLFGPFRLRPLRHMLLKGERPVPVGSRALEILIALVEMPGRLVTKEQLFARAWPHVIVEESSLRAQIAALRKVLQDEADESPCIVSVPGQGYRFVSPTSTAQVDSAPHASQPGSLPVRLTPVIGRSDEIGVLDARLQRCRFVSMVGPGGVGKTTVAVAVAAQTAARYRDGVCFLDVASLTEASLLPSVLAAALGVSLGSEDIAAGLTAQLASRQLLLVLDNCEHLVDATTRLVEQMLKGAPALRVLVTSREPLRAEGESVYRLPMLDSPPPVAGLSAAQVMDYPAVALFVERTTARMADFRLLDADAAIVADICRQLDGIALAIELAAGRIDAFGLRGIAERLNDRFRLLKGGRRTALPRHQTLLATLDWSYDALGTDEQAILRALAVFAGGFSFDAAAAVTAARFERTADIVDVMANLVSRSLVSADVEHRAPRYRLMESTRAYAIERLEACDEQAVTARAHAEHFRQVFGQALQEWEIREPMAWLADYAPETYNLRAALEWAFAPGGDVSLGIELTTSAIPLWFRLSATDECRDCVQRALSRGESAEAHEAQTRQIMQLYAALGLSRAFTIGLAPAARAAWLKALHLAEHLNDREFQREALWGLWMCQIGDAEYRDALATAQRFSQLAEGAPDVQMAHRLVGVPRHCLGDHAGARLHIDRGLEPAVPLTSAGVRFRFGQPMAARVMLAQMLWLQGCSDQAMEAAQRSVEESRASGHAISHCDALAQAVCPIALRVGSYETAEHAVDLLLRLAEQHSLGRWSVLGRCWKGALQIARGQRSLGIPTLTEGLHLLREVRFAFYRTQFMGTLAAAMAEQGDLSQALSLIDQALARCQAKEEFWCLAEIVRLKGSIIARADSTDPRAEEHFRQSLCGAVEHGALSWELRAALSLAELQARAGRAEEGRRALAEVYGRFTEGFASADLRAAQHFIDANA